MLATIGKKLRVSNPFSVGLLFMVSVCLIGLLSTMELGFQSFSLLVYREGQAEASIMSNSANLMSSC